MITKETCALSRCKEGVGEGQVGLLQRPGPLWAAPRFYSVAQRAPEQATHPPARWKRGPGQATSPVPGPAEALRGGGSDCLRGFPRPAACAPRGGTDEEGGGTGGAGPAPPPPLLLPGSASSKAALSPGAPLGCQREAATCSGAESLLCAPRGRAATPPPAPRKLPLLLPPGKSCRRRFPASEEKKSSTRSTAREKNTRGRAAPLRRCLPVPPRQAGWWSPPPPPASPAAAARCRRRRCSASCSQSSACRQVSARPREEATASPPSRPRLTWRRGDRGCRWRCLLAACCCRWGRPPSLQQRVLTPTSGSLRGRAAGVSPGRWCPPHPVSPPGGAGGGWSGWADVASSEGRAGVAPAVRGGERWQSFFPRGKRRWDSSGVLSPGSGRPEAAGAAPAGGTAEAWRGVRFSSRLSGTSPQWAASNFGGSPPTFSAACGRDRLPAGRRVPTAFALLMGTSAGRGVPAERRWRDASGKRREAAPLSASPCAGQLRSHAWWQRCVGWGCSGGSSSRGNFPPLPPPPRSVKALSRC